MTCCKLVFDRGAALEYHITKVHVSIPSRCLVCLMARAFSGEIVYSEWSIAGHYSPIMPKGIVKLSVPGNFQNKEEHSESELLITSPAEFNHLLCQVFFLSPFAKSMVKRQICCQYPKYPEVLKRRQYPSQR